MSLPLEKKIDFKPQYIRKNPTQICVNATRGLNTLLRKIFCCKNRNKRLGPFDFQKELSIHFVVSDIFPGAFQHALSILISSENPNFAYLAVVEMFATSRCTLITEKEN